MDWKTAEKDNEQIATEGGEIGLKSLLWWKRRQNPVEMVEGNIKRRELFEA